MTVLSLTPLRCRRGNERRCRAHSQHGKPRRDARRSSSAGARSYGLSTDGRAFRRGLPVVLAALARGALATSSIVIGACLARRGPGAGEGVSVGLLAAIFVS